MSEIVSRAGEKLQFAMNEFKIDVKGLVCADFGSNVGGFVDVLLKHGAAKVYSVETGYGVLDWNLRNDPRVVVLEKTNAMHVTLPEKMDFISVDVSWTPQLKVLPNVLNNLKPGGTIVSLIKPHYEASNRHIKLHKGKLDDELAKEIVATVAAEMDLVNIEVLGQVKSPITGGKAGNAEYLLWLKPFSFLGLVKKLKALDLPLGHYILVGSAPLAIRDIRPANDLDILLDQELRVKLSKKYPTELDGGIEKLVIANKIDAAVTGDVIYNDPTIASLPEMIKTADIIDGIPYLNLELTKAYKRKIGRAKDLLDIDLIDQYLAK